LTTGGASPQDETPRRGRWLLWGGGGLLTLALAGAGSAWMLRTAIAEAAVSRWCSGQGLECEVEVTRLGLGRVEIEGLAIKGNGGTPLTLARGAAELSWPELFVPEVRAISLSGLKLNGRLKEDEFDFYGLESLLETGGDGGVGAVPRVSLTDGRILLETDSGPVQLDLDAEGRFPAEFSVDARLSATDLRRGSERVSLERGALSVTWTDGIPEGSGALEISRLEAEGVTLDGLVFDLAATPTGPDTYRVDLSGRAAAIANGPRSAEAVQFEASARGAAPQGDRVADIINAMEAMSLRLTTGRINAPEAGALGVAAEIELERDYTGAVTGPVFLSGEAASFGGASFERLNVDGTLNVRLDGASPVAAGLAATLAASGAALGPELREMVRSAVSLPAPFDAHGSELGDALSNAFGRFDGATQLSADWTAADGINLELHDTARVRAASGFNLTLTPRQSADWLRYSPRGLRVSGDVLLEGGGAPEIAAGITTLEWLSASGDMRLDAEPLAIKPWQAGDLTLGLSADRLKVTRTGDRLRVSGVGETFLDGDIAGLDVTETRLFAGIDAVQDASGWRMQMEGTDCLALRTDGIRSGTLRFEPFAVSLCPDEGRLLQREEGATQGRAQIGDLNIAFSGKDLAGGVSLEGARADWTLTDHFRIRIAADAATVPLTLPSGSLRLRTRAPLFDLELLPAAPRITASLDDTQISGSLVPASVDAGKLTFEGFAEPMGLRASGAYRDVRVSDLNREDPVYEPIQADGTYQWRGARLTSQGEIGLADKPYRLATARMDMDVFTLNGFLTLEGDRLQFDPGGLQPGDISGRVVGFFTEASGSVTPRADLTLTDGKLAGTGSVLLDRLSWITLRFGSVDEVSGLVEFDDLLGLTTPPGQKLYVLEINPGIPLRNGELSFQLLGADEARLEKANWPFAGGMLEIQPTRWTVQANLETVIAEMREIELARLVELLSVPDLRITGTASGRFPVTLSGADVLIKDARLEVSEGGGVVQYTGAAGEQAGMADEKAEMTFDALRNLQFSVLSMTVNGNLLGDLRVDAEILGSNAEVLDGQLFQMNIGVEGALIPLINKTTRLLSGQEVEDFVIDLMRQEGASRKDDE
jgi:translocation and assembly module TamB